MIRRTTVAWKRRGDPHAQIHFPPLTAEEALLVNNLLDRAIAALWRTHGNAMADLLACLQPDEQPQAGPDDAHVATADNDRGSDDDLF